MLLFGCQKVTFIVVFCIQAGHVRCSKNVTNYVTFGCSKSNIHCRDFQSNLGSQKVWLLCSKTAPFGSTGLPNCYLCQAQVLQSATEPSERKMLQKCYQKCLQHVAFWIPKAIHIRNPSCCKKLDNECYFWWFQK